MERRNTNQCFRSTEEDNHGVESHKNLVGEECLENFLHSFDSQKDMTINALSIVF
jgi:hypothetical protein